MSIDGKMSELTVRVLYRLTFLFVLAHCVCRIPIYGEAVRNCTLMGNVLSDRNDSVHAKVTAFRLDVRQGRIVPDMECSTNTDSEGRYQCQRLRPGTYAIVVNFPQRLTHARHSAAKSMEAANLPLFALYPQSTDLEPADLPHLEAGETRWVDIWVGADLLSTIHVKPAPGAANSHLKISIQGDDFSLPIPNIGVIASSPDREYLLEGVPPGTYAVAESWHVDGGYRKYGESHEAVGTVTVNQRSPNEITLAEVKLQTVSGSVQYADQVTRRAREVILKVSTNEGATRYAVPVAKDGSFTFNEVPAGAYDVLLNAKDELYISEASIGGRSIRGTTIEVGDGISLPLTIVAAHTSATITGSLEINGTEPKPGIVVQSLDAHTNLIVPVDTRGSFAVDGLAPGQYRLYGWEDIDSVPYDSPHFLARYANKAVSFELGNSSHLTGLEVECNKTNL